MSARAIRLSCSAPLAAAGFGAMAIFGKLAYGAGAGVLELLAVRFVIATGVLGALAAPSRRDRPRAGARSRPGSPSARSPTPSRRGCSSPRSPHGRLGRRARSSTPTRPRRARRDHCSAASMRRRRELGALALGTAGVALVLLGGDGARARPPRRAPRARRRAGYTTTSSWPTRSAAASTRCPGDARVRGRRGLVHVAGAVTGSLTLALRPAGLAVRRRARASSPRSSRIAAFLAGHGAASGRAARRSSRRSSRPITLALAFLVFGETLDRGQVAGAALVLAAVVVLQARGLRSPRRVRCPLSPPVLPQLAKSAKSLPSGSGWAYERKWDGFRALAFVEDGELAVPPVAQRPPAEAVLPRAPVRCRARTCSTARSSSATSGGARGLRRARPAHPPRRSRGSSASRARPRPGYVAFDLLADGDEVLLELPLSERAPARPSRRWSGRPDRARPARPHRRRRPTSGSRTPRASSPRSSRAPTAPASARAW